MSGATSSERQLGIGGRDDHDQGATWYGGRIYGSSGSSGSGRYARLITDVLATGLGDLGRERTRR